MDILRDKEGLSNIRLIVYTFLFVKKNGHNAYMVEYSKGERIKAMIGWYCDGNDLIYLVDVDVYDESELMRINNDVLCVHE